MDAILCRYAEIALKGNNRFLFEKRLAENIKICLKKNIITGTVRRIRGRIIILTTDENALSHVKNVFGLSSISPATIVNNNIKNITEECIKQAEQINPKSFRITAKRTNKDFPIESIEISRIIGGAVQENLNIPVKLKQYDLEIGIEIHNQTFIYTKKIGCYGGLPVGSSGTVACLIEDKAGIFAAWLLLKRGCNIFIYTFKKIDCSKLEKYAYGTVIKPVKISNYDELNYLIEKEKCKAVIFGNTLSNFDNEQQQKIKKIALTPLIAYDEKQITEIWQKI